MRNINLWLVFITFSRASFRVPLKSILLLIRHPGPCLHPTPFTLPPLTHLSSPLLPSLLKSDITSLVLLFLSFFTLEHIEEIKPFTLYSSFCPLSPSTPRQPPFSRVALLPCRLSYTKNRKKRVYPSPDTLPPLTLLFPRVLPYPRGVLLRCPYVSLFPETRTSRREQTFRPSHAL